MVFGFFWVTYDVGRRRARAARARAWVSGGSAAAQASWGRAAGCAGRGLADSGAGKCVAELQLGEESSGVLTSEGLLYMWGNGEGGRLGLGHSQLQPTPMRVTWAIEEERVTLMCLGRCWSCLLAS